MRKILYYIFFFSLLLIQSCKTKQKASELNYMQNIEEVAQSIAMQQTPGILQSGDELVILVSAKDNDVVLPFNKNYSSTQVIQNAVPASGNTPSTGNTIFSGPLYIVDTQGFIDFPVIGKLEVSGKTLSEFQDELRNRISYYVKTPTVNIRLTNFKITLLGEVNRPGEYTISEGQTTILKAIGLAGDLTVYGKRDNILVIRNEGGNITQGRVDLKDANFINSPFYYLKQGDVISVAANENREITASTNPNTGLYISIASVAVGALAIIISLFK